MTQPRDALLQAVLCLTVGLALGIWYGFLRPLRRKHPHLSDGLFILGAFYGWLVSGFAICKGDLRLAYTAAMFLGIWLMDRTAGRLLRPVFDLVW